MVADVQGAESVDAEEYAGDAARDEEHQDAVVDLAATYVNGKNCKLDGRGEGERGTHRGGRRETEKEYEHGRCNTARPYARQPDSSSDQESQYEYHLPAPSDGSAFGS